MRRPGIQKVPAHIRKLLGPPPILSIESEEDYYATMAAVAAAVKPDNDLLVWFSIKDAVDARLEIARYTRIKPLLITEAEAYQRKTNLENQLEEASIAELEEVVADLERQLTQAAKTDRQFIGGADPNLTLQGIAAAWKGWTRPMDETDRLLSSAHRRYNNALGELERYRLRLFGWPQTARPGLAPRQGAPRLLPTQASAGVGQRRRARNS